MERDWSNAVNHYEITWDVDPENITTTFYLGMSYRQAGNPKDSIQTLEIGLSTLSIKRDGFFANYYVQLGLAYEAVGLKDEAINAFEMANNALEQLGEPRTQQRKIIKKPLNDYP